MRAGILRMIRDYKEKHGGSLLFITHDLATAKLVSDRIAVMYLGKIVELGPAGEVLTRPLHPYTVALLAAIPRLSRRSPPVRVELRGDIPDPTRVPRLPAPPPLPLRDGNMPQRGAQPRGAPQRPPRCLPPPPRPWSGGRRRRLM